MFFTKKKREKGIYELFEISVLLKGANALLELILGGVLLFVNVGDILQVLVQNELVEDPNDFLAIHVANFATHFSPEVQFYSALYLLAHGAIKIVLVVGLLRRYRWAFPATLAVLSLFVAYESITFLRTHSLPLAILTVFDLVLIVLVWHEYRRMSREGGFRP
jgi:uncharacterized membrane protein